MGWRRGILLLMLLGSLTSRGLAAELMPETAAKAVLLMEQETGTILYEENAHQRLEPASVTKVMTMLLTVEALESGQLTLDQVVTASSHAAGMGGSQIYLKEGEQMTVDDLLKATAVASGNDAAAALAEEIAGSEEGFVRQMNQRAAQLGMEDTQFQNCTGLPAEGHYTSAWDIGLMSRQLLEYPLIRSYTGIWMDTLRQGQFQLANTNKLIYYYEGATGLKTGSTDGAGYCISASACRDGMELIAVVMGSETSGQRFESAKSLLNYGFSQWVMADPLSEISLEPVAVTLGEAELVTPVPAEQSRFPVRREQLGEIQTEVQLAERVEAPVRQGQVLGQLVVTVGGQAREPIPLTALRGTGRRSAASLFRQMMGAV